MAKQNGFQREVTGIQEGLHVGRGLRVGRAAAIAFRPERTVSMSWVARRADARPARCARRDALSSCDT